MNSIPRRIALIMMLLLVTSIAAVFLFLATAIVPYWSSLDGRALQDWFAGPFTRFSNMMVPLHFASISVGVAAVFLFRGTDLLRPICLAFLCLFICQALNFFLFGADINPALASGDLSNADVTDEYASWQQWHWVRTVAITLSSLVLAVSALFLEEE